jgi:L-amino acid N-acyltransferase YncA
MPWSDPGGRPPTTPADIAAGGPDIAQPAAGGADVVIREVRPSDAAGIVAVLNPIIATGAATTLTTALAEDDERRYIAGFPSRGLFVVAVADDGVIVGLQSVEPFDASTHAFDHVGVIGTFVDLGWRRRGVASRLFAATFAAAPGKGYEKLFTYIRADNAAGLTAYARRGFEVVGVARRHARIAGRYIDEVMVERFLVTS